ncbi:hypothetical protein CLCR_01012 [Cladophialophora carrionii]|uniref:Uncharacterized protein n=1 Tax=Cladophialophora carrionii TaxID=86049 RepID=A0A1C1D124_9EURO|nr:hypothetical protein CLCR_01012 [Cladophialophora carrionii]
MAVTLQQLNSYYHLSGGKEKSILVLAPSPPTGGLAGGCLVERASMGFLMPSPHLASPEALQRSQNSKLTHGRGNNGSLIDAFAVLVEVTRI